MSPALTGLLISSASVLLLALFFAYEERRGARFFPRLRTYADMAVLKSSVVAEEALRFIGRDLVRHVMRYIYHRVLRALLFVVRRAEHTMEHAMRVNRTLAQSAERERAERNKLDEIAFHKAATALTEEEKRRHRDKMLEG